MNSQFIHHIKIYQPQRSKAILHIFEVSLHLLKIDSSAFTRSFPESATSFQIVVTPSQDVSMSVYLTSLQSIPTPVITLTPSQDLVISATLDHHSISTTPSNYPASVTEGKLSSIISTPSKSISVTATLKSYPVPLINNNNSYNTNN